jgi:hypothetical protein
VGPRRDRHWILEVAVVVFGSDPLPFWMHVEREKFRVIWFVLAIYVARERERERERQVGVRLFCRKPKLNPPTMYLLSM